MNFSKLSIAGGVLLTSAILSNQAHSGPSITASSDEGAALMKMLGGGGETDPSSIVANVDFGKETVCEKIKLQGDGSLEGDDTITFGAQSKDEMDFNDALTNISNKVTKAISVEMKFSKDPFVVESKLPVVASLKINPDQIGQATDESKESVMMGAPALVNRDMRQVSGLDSAFPTDDSEVSQEIQDVVSADLADQEAQHVGQMAQLFNAFKNTYSQLNITLTTQNKEQIIESVKQWPTRVSTIISYHAKQDEIYEELKGLVLGMGIIEKKNMPEDLADKYEKAQILFKENGEKFEKMKASYVEHNSQYTQKSKAALAAVGGEKSKLSEADKAAFAKEREALLAEEKAVNDFAKEARAQTRELKDLNSQVVAIAQKVAQSKVDHVKADAAASMPHANMILMLTNYLQKGNVPGSSTGAANSEIRPVNKAYLCQSEVKFIFPTPGDDGRGDMKTLGSVLRDRQKKAAEERAKTGHGGVRRVH